jgi:hypothetical protein
MQTFDKETEKLIKRIERAARNPQAPTLEPEGTPAALLPA